MMYNEMLKLLKDKNIRAVQFEIAEEVNKQLVVDENEFEIICRKVYEEYLCYVGGKPDICDIVNEILILRNHKER